MLTMTESALFIVRKFTANPQIDERSGVRIARRSASDALQVGAVPAPEPSDVVVEQSGGRVFLGPEAADRLQDKVLDVRTDAVGRVEFFVSAA